MAAMLITIIIIIIFTVICCSFTRPVVASTLASICTGVSTEGNYEYENNVQSVLSKVASKALDVRLPGYFDTAPAGDSPNKVYGSYCCRGDLINTPRCRDCVLNVTEMLSESTIFNSECYGMGGSGPTDQCMVTYTNRTLGYKNGSVISCGGIGAKEVRNYEQYNQTLLTTFEGLIREAAVGNWSRPNFETRVVKVINNTEHDHHHRREKIYTLVQCNADISALNCSKCLGESLSFVPTCCGSTKSGGVIHANCMIKYSNQSFFGSANSSFMPKYLHVLMVALMYISFLYK